MKLFAWVLIAVASTFHLPYALAVPAETPARVMLQTLDIQDSWQFACKLKQMDCSKIDPPKVAVEPLFQNYGAFGMYSPMEGGFFPEDTVVLDGQLLPFLQPVYVQAVLAHEMTHYIDHAYKGLDFTDGCIVEWNGWRAMNAYVVSRGHPEFADYNWQERYGCFGAGVTYEE